MGERTPFKEFAGAALAEELAQRVAAVAPDFPVGDYLAAVTPELPALELKGRVALLADALRAHLPADYRAALTTLLAILGPPLAEGEGMFTHGWYLMPVAAFVERHGVADPEASLPALHAITQRHTAEFAIRPFLVAHQARTLATLEAWAGDESHHVRRLVSEGSRPRLPWAPRLSTFIADPSPVLALLERLKDDPSVYVRTSVANSLNDMAKDHPALVLARLTDWRTGANEGRRWIIGRALRTLVKRGDPVALSLLGAEAPAVALAALTAEPLWLRPGEAVTVTARLRSLADAPQALIVDYILHRADARGGSRPTVFKLRRLTLAAGAEARLVKRHSFRPVVTRRYYAGPHRIELQVNGAVLGGVDITLVGAPTDEERA